MVIGARERSWRVAPIVAAAISLVLIAFAVGRGIVRRSAGDELRQRFDEIDGTNQLLRRAEARLPEIAGEQETLDAQRDELEAIVPTTDARVEADLVSDAWRSGFAVTSVSLPRVTRVDEGAELRFTMQARSGTATWLGALDRMRHAPRVYDVESIRVIDPADPDANVEIDVVTHVSSR